MAAGQTTRLAVDRRQRGWCTADLELMTQAAARWSRRVTERFSPRTGAGRRWPSASAVSASSPPRRGDSPTARSSSRRRGTGEFVSGEILFDETVRQRIADGTTARSYCVPRHDLGIKVDKGTSPLAGFPGELATDGLDGLRGCHQRCPMVCALLYRTLAPRVPGDMRDPGSGHTWRCCHRRGRWSTWHGDRRPACIVGAGGRAERPFPDDLSVST